MNKYIVALSIDKVQTFLTEAIHAHTQEKQAEENTLKSVMQASHEISDCFFADIQNCFPDRNLKEVELLACSGVYIFHCDLPELCIKERINGLFLRYYRNSGGQKLLRYNVFLEAEFHLQNHAETESLEKIAVIQEAKRRLKGTEIFNEIIEKNRSVLFNFQSLKKASFDKNGKIADEFPLFVTELDKLKHEDKDKYDPQKRFKIAVIKADLDGMGDMFKSLSDYDEYQKISKLLYDEVSLKGLHKAVTNVSKNMVKDDANAQQGWIFPFYVAGDDIFFAVKIGNLLRGIEVCKKLLDNIKNSLSSDQCKMSMSIGVAITQNREPIRYYLEMVESQLKLAKDETCPLILKNELDAKIAIGNLAFFDLNYARIKARKGALKGSANKDKKQINRELSLIPAWYAFLHQLRVLRWIQDNERYRQELGRSRFFYTLLEKLCDPSVESNDIKYMNQLLYHLIPKYMEQPELYQAEVLLKAGILEQVGGKGENGFEFVMLKGKKEGEELFLRLKLIQKRKKRLESYLRLMLLFCDERFSIAEEKNKNGKYFNEIELKNAGKILLFKTTDYLYENSLYNNQFKNVFVQKMEFFPKDKNRKRFSYYKKIHIEKSMFFKLRDTKKINIEKAKNMILGYAKIFCGEEKESKKMIMSGKEYQQTDQPDYHMDFDSDKFCRLAHAWWNVDYIDSLMLFYQYHDMCIRNKILMKNQKGGGTKSCKTSFNLK
ncbi:Cas10/Cmr2 second palm domain-containing protein [Anaerosinus massiliensis]|uniref:Cas10/Cmr2 second palm domain-containing protein n=1 Tax=Massilibacillus massiliensis TaxID=1806837 RepID=UPI000DA5FA8F|nr:hypothetical protein [Massilibacillus massiliensis]